MTKSMTGSFYLTETVQLPVTAVSGDRVQGTIDLGAYVNVPTGQAIAISECDFIWQIGTDFSGPIAQAGAGDCALNSQLTDLNPGGAFVRADDSSLIASQHIDIDDSANLSTSEQDIFPDNFGPAALSEAFLVVNDQMYLVAGIDGADVDVDVLYCTVRIRAQVVKLSNRDWMALALQSTAADS